MQGSRPNLLLVSNEGSTPSRQRFSNDGSGGGMDRIGRLEEDVKDIKDTLKGLVPMLSAINERTKNMPTTLGMTVIIITIFLGALAIPNIPNIIDALKTSAPKQDVSSPLPSPGASQHTIP